MSIHHLTPISQYNRLKIYILSWFTPSVFTQDGVTYCYRYGKLHSVNDRPAVIFDGTRQWFRYGNLHRDNDLPAVINDEIRMSWYWNGYLHRNGDQPAVVSVDGCQEWHRYGKRHRDGDQPAVVADGWLAWYQNDERHRDNGQPALICTKNGIISRTWWFEGYAITEEQSKRFSERIQRERLRIEWFIRDRLVSKLYDPRTAPGQRRMIESYEDLL
jgi:hypothetical protein